MKTFLKVWLGIGLIAIGFGIIILIVAAGTGGFRNNHRTYSLSENYINVKSIDMEIGYGTVMIEEGSEFSIQADNLIYDQLESYIDQSGTWIVRENENADLELFGIHINLDNLISWNDDFIPEIVITLPKDYVADHFEFHIGAGYASADNIQAKEGSFTVGAGKFEIDQLAIKNRSVYTVGTGEMILSRLDAENISVDCGVGDIIIEGTVSGNNNIKCGIGKVDLELNGEEENYSYQITSGIGNVSINDSVYQQISNKVINHKDAVNHLNLDCGIGNISVEFN